MSLFDEEYELFDEEDELLHKELYFEDIVNVPDDDTSDTDDDDTDDDDTVYGTVYGTDGGFSGFPGCIIIDDPKCSEFSVKKVKLSPSHDNRVTMSFPALPGPDDKKHDQKHRDKIARKVRRHIYSSEVWDRIVLHMREKAVLELSQEQSDENFVIAFIKHHTQHDNRVNYQVMMFVPPIGNDAA
jgi:hypothetical protein